VTRVSTFKLQTTTSKIPVYNILGLNFGHDGSAAILKNGRLVCAIANERLSRKKKAENVTREMVQYVLEGADLTLDQIHFVALCTFVYDPGNYVKFFDKQGRECTRNFFDVIGPDTIVESWVTNEGRRIQSAFVHHHMAHAAAAFYTSPFERAACLTMDASRYRPEACSLFAYGEGRNLHYLYCPGLMIGNAYSYFTEKLGLGPGLTKAGTTMALASFGEPSPVARARWEYFGQSFYERIDQRSDDVFMNLMWSELSGMPPHTFLSKEQSDSKQAMEIAASLEYIFEQTILRSANELHARTTLYNDNNLCLGGGSFLNSIVNMQVKQQTAFENVHLFPACGDDGTAVGAALYLAHQLLGVPRNHYPARDFMYLGRPYAVNDSGGVAYDADQVAAAISKGAVVAFFTGGSEFGPRALGHRSILADPRNPEMKDILNRRVKHREWFRPFAPVVLSERAAEWFEIDFESKLMLFIAPIKSPKKLPAVAHIDGSARLQTIMHEDNPKLYELIQAFDRLTGVPVLLNTSLNDNGEPLVETPQDALNFFENQDVDFLVLEDRVYAK
jgi:carbamoyltransferase